MTFTVQKIDHVVLYVTDLDRAKRFYETVLGCKLLRHNEKLDLMHLAAGSSMIDLLLLPEQDGAGRNVDHIALQVTPFDAAAISAHCAATGWNPRHHAIVSARAVSAPR